MHIPVGNRVQGHLTLTLPMQSPADLRGTAGAIALLAAAVVVGHTLVLDGGVLAR